MTLKKDKSYLAGKSEVSRFGVNLQSIEAEVKKAIRSLGIEGRVSFANAHESSEGEAEVVLYLEREDLKFLSKIGFEVEDNLGAEFKGEDYSRGDGLLWFSLE
jgi:hypothetical protein